MATNAPLNAIDATAHAFDKYYDLRSAIEATADGRYVIFDGVDNYLWGTAYEGRTLVYAEMEGDRVEVVACGSLSGHPGDHLATFFPTGWVYLTMAGRTGCAIFAQHLNRLLPHGARVLPIGGRPTLDMVIRGVDCSAPLCSSDVVAIAADGGGASIHDNGGGLPLGESMPRSWTMVDRIGVAL